MKKKALFFCCASVFFQLNSSVSSLGYSSWIGEFENSKNKTDYAAALQAFILIEGAYTYDLAYNNLTAFTKAVKDHDADANVDEAIQQYQKSLADLFKSSVPQKIAQSKKTKEEDAKIIRNARGFIAAAWAATMRIENSKKRNPDDYDSTMFYAKEGLDNIKNFEQIYKKYKDDASFADAFKQPFADYMEYKKILIDNEQKAKDNLSDIFSKLIEFEDAIDTAYLETINSKDYTEFVNSFVRLDKSIKRLSINIFSHEDPVTNQRKYTYFQRALTEIEGKQYERLNKKTENIKDLVNQNLFERMEKNQAIAPNNVPLKKDIENELKKVQYRDDSFTVLKNGLIKALKTSYIKSEKNYDNSIENLDLIQKKLQEMSKIFKSYDSFDGILLLLDEAKKVLSKLFRQYEKANKSFEEKL